MPSHDESPIRPRPELLAPAGDFDCVRAAVANGADAVYFGLDCGFNARARAANFAPDDLPEVMRFLHRYGVKGYVTFNTLVFSDELATAERTIRQIALAGTDAVLVQDLGLVELIRRVAPTLAIHASTQMTLSSAECIAMVEELGIERVVLARELSVDEIRRIDAETRMPLEAFVHGALCVAYSGQCLTSESLGGRSANRGQCAQACRLPYELICDGEEVDLGDQRYLLSPQDLAAYALIPDLIDAGVMSLKIEGRLKTPEYVANITRHYRQAIDAAMAGRPVEFTERQVEEMELSFSRGFSPGWLQGCDHKMLVPATSSAKRGVEIGVVTSIDRRRGAVEIELDGRLKAGDGIVFEGDRAAGSEQGGRVFTLRHNGERVADEVAHGRVVVDFPRGAVDVSTLSTGLRVWKTDDPVLTRELRRSFTGDIRDRDRPVRVNIEAVIGQSLRLQAQADGLPMIELATESPLEAARRHPLTQEVLEQQFSRLGGTGFALQHLEATIEGEPMVPLSVLGQLRRQLQEQLVTRRDAALNDVRHAVAPEVMLPVLRSDAASRRASSAADHHQPTGAELLVLVRTLSQLRAAAEFGAAHLYADFQDIREYSEAVSIARTYGASIHLATPRIQKPGEIGVFRAMQRHGADGFLVRNLSGLSFCGEHNVPRIADFSLNATNELTVDWLLRHGALRVTASYDMNREQLLVMAEHSPVERLEVVIHQHMPMFHMEHCVFCAVLSPGTNKTNCGRPCDVHQVRLRDRVGMEHPLLADVGCRNTLFNQTPQSGAEVVASLIELGVRHFRIELLGEQSRDDIVRVIELYQRLLAGQTTGTQVWQTLKATNRVGVTRGTLEHDRDPLALI